MKKSKNLIGLWVNVSRAYEIALLGNFSIQIVFEKEYTEGFSDYEKIKSFYKGVDFVKNGDLIVEISKPDYSIKTERCETIDDIKARVRDAKAHVTPTEFANNSCDALLKNATNRLSFSLETREKTIEISQVIAQLDGAKKINAWHMVEAIQYKCYDHTLCNAEERTVNFGKGIKIALHELDVTDIENAIKYLKGVI